MTRTICFSLQTACLRQEINKGTELSVEQLLRFLSGNLEKAPEDLITAVKDYIDSFTSEAKQHDRPDLPGTSDKRLVPVVKNPLSC